VVLALPLLAALVPVTGFLLLLYRLSGPGVVRFIREERIGLNYRQAERRRQGGKVPIDRRFNDRRSRPLPGRPFLTYRMVLLRDPRRGPQRALARFLRRRRLDRVLALWSVVRGDMSLVGPSARLARESAYQEDWASAWIFARRPGLTGPGAIFGNGNVAGRRRADLYDGYYSRFGGIRLDLDSLLHAFLSLTRAEEISPAEEEPVMEPAGLSTASRQEG
jgi:lipopolysaccharide/colanic/teichoic acid biosynthesis glycosyltransferase